MASQRSGDHNLLTLKELSAQSRLSVSTLRRLVRQGRIKFFQPAGKAGKLLFPTDAIERIDEPASTGDDPGRTLPGRRPGWM